MNDENVTFVVVDTKVDLEVCLCCGTACSNCTAGAGACGGIPFDILCDVGFDIDRGFGGREKLTTEARSNASNTGCGVRMAGLLSEAQQWQRRCLTMPLCTLHCHSQPTS